MSKYYISTQCVHAGTDEISSKEGINTPLYPSSAFPYDKGVIYPRYFNTSNHKVLASKIAQLEQAESALITSSGMAAITSVLYTFLETGDHAVFADQLYGGTLGLIKNDFRHRGIEYDFVDFNDTEAIKKAIREETKLVYFESPSNPLLKITDIAQVVQAAGKEVRTIMDNTFASPINQVPLNFGVDIVLHSGTKYLGGHSDLTFGAIATSQELVDPITQTAKLYGGNINTLDAYLIERSLKTLAIRVQQQNENAGALALYLHKHPKVLDVFYPGLPSHPGFPIAGRQMLGFGGMLSFSLKEDTKAAADKLLKQLKLIQPAVSLGGVESLISSPMDTSHAGLTASERQKTGIQDSLLRLSVGIEEEEDLIADLEQALEAVE